MGLWLKCPGCHAKNPLAASVCVKCGGSLDNLSVDKRVYLIGPEEEAAPAVQPPPPAQAVVPAAPVAAATKPVKQPNKPRKKKS